LGGWSDGGECVLEGFVELGHERFALASDALRSGPGDVEVIDVKPHRSRAGFDLRKCSGQGVLQL